jgi:hypothetical protein
MSDTDQEYGTLTTDQIAAAAPATHDRTGPAADAGTAPPAHDRTGPAADAGTAPLAHDRTGPVEDDRAAPVADERNTSAADERTDTAAMAADTGPNTPVPTQLLAGAELDEMVARWKEIQTQFVDEPRRAVHDADALVADLMQRLAQIFATERGNLESQWAGGGDVSTEDLRQGLQRYRSFFERLLAV